MFSSVDLKNLMTRQFYSASAGSSAASSLAVGIAPVVPAKSVANPQASSLALFPPVPVSSSSRMVLVNKEFVTFECVAGMEPMRNYLP